MNDGTATIAPPPSRLDGDLAAARAALGQAGKAAHLAGHGAWAFSRTAIYCKTPQAVDLIAAQWGVAAKWSTYGNSYYAEVSVGGAAIEAVFNGQRPAATTNEVAAA